MNTVIRVENLSKQYRLGEYGTGTITHDLNRWWHKIRGKEDPYLKIGDVNDRATKGTSEYAWALRDINFEVKQGEVLGIIGKNGAGKSTLLKILSRVTTPTTGSIKAKGRIASLLEVGTGFNDELTGRENIFLNGAILGMTKAEIFSKFDEIVDFSGTERYIDTPVKRYSSGMRVRLAFAVAAHLEPEILIVDEVLAVGDAEFQNKAIGKMQDISTGQGRTVLFVSHNLAAVKSLCHTGLVLQNGSFYMQGTAEEAIEAYNNFNQVDENKFAFSVNQNELALCRTEGFNVVSIIINGGANRVVSGEECTITVNYVSDKEFVAPGFTFCFKDKQGYEILRLSNMPISGYRISKIKGKGSITLSIPRLPLVKGTYYIDFGFARERMSWFFFRENLIMLKVEGNDIYNSGLELDQSKGLIWVDHNWMN